MKKFKNYFDKIVNEVAIKNELRELPIEEYKKIEEAAHDASVSIINKNELLHKYVYHRNQYIRDQELQKYINESIDSLDKLFTYCHNITR